MAEPDALSDRVSERLSALNRELARQREQREGQPGYGRPTPLVEFHSASIRALWELVGMLAHEVDELKGQSAPPG